MRLIDVVWVDGDAQAVAAAFEVARSTSIYSGIVRMLDLALGAEVGENSTLFSVAPDQRLEHVAQQLRRPAFSRVSELGIRNLPYGELRSHRVAIARFGVGLKPRFEFSARLLLTRPRGSRLDDRGRGVRTMLDIPIVGRSTVGSSTNLSRLEHSMTTFEVKDMTCGHCVSTITKAVKALDSGAEVQIDLATHRVTIDPTKADAAELREAIKEAGYTPVPVDTGVEPVAAKASPKRGGCCCS